MIADGTMNSTSSGDRTLRVVVGLSAGIRGANGQTVGQQPDRPVDLCSFPNPLGFAP